MLENQKIGIAFDLDGVITATARLHFRAWQLEALKWGMHLTKEQNDRLRGLNRQKTALAICKLNNVVLSKNDLNQFCYQKNKLYKEYLKNELDDSFILGHAKQTLLKLKQHGYRIVITSSSRNAPMIISKLNLNVCIHAIVDPDTILHSKPFPDLYLKAAELLNIPPQHMIGVEDAPAGVEGIIAAKMISVAIKWTNDIKQFSKADYILATADDLTFDFLEGVINEHFKIKNS